MHVGGGCFCSCGGRRYGRWPYASHLTVEAADGAEAVGADVRVALEAPAQGQDLKDVVELGMCESVRGGRRAEGEAGGKTNSGHAPCRSTRNPSRPSASRLFACA